MASGSKVSAGVNYGWHGTERGSSSVIYCMLMSFVFCCWRRSGQVELGQETGWSRITRSPCTGATLDEAYPSLDSCLIGTASSNRATWGSFFFFVWKTTWRRMARRFVEERGECASVPRTTHLPFPSSQHPCIVGCWTSHGVSPGTSSNEPSENPG